MKTIFATIFALALLGAGAASADVGAGIHIGPVGVGAHVGDGVGVGAHVGTVGAGVGVHGDHHRCSEYGWRHHERYCRHYY